MASVFASRCCIVRFPDRAYKTAAATRLHLQAPAPLSSGNRSSGWPELGRPVPGQNCPVCGRPTEMRQPQSVGILDSAKKAATDAESNVRKQIRDEARAAVMPWVLLSIALALYANRSRR